ncbi:uncharacterized protein LOC119724034 [Patiria miniata]|uniref:Reverse transcriptase domain-containing protein n=1 Tax=Patiria miniata TaxID=46514 RepID=A0A913ZGH4_PATMI|nr:uncharacterized protein LOC119724034 [Patiria miniata]
MMDEQAEVEHVFEDLDIEGGPFNDEEYVTSVGGVTESFDILTGVLQGDILAPFLFIIVLYYALRKAINIREEELGFTIVPRKSRRLSHVMITDMDFAYDIALVSNTVEQARTLLLSVEEECLKVGLQLNTKKTKVLAYNISGTAVCTRDGTTLKVESDYKYLGARISSRHCVRHLELAASQIILWETTLGTASRGRRNISFVDMLKRETSLTTAEELRSCMLDRDMWTKIIGRARAAKGPQLD